MELYAGMKVRLKPNAATYGNVPVALIGPIPDGEWGMWALSTKSGLLIARSEKWIRDFCEEVVEPKVVHSMDLFGLDYTVGELQLRIDRYDDDSIVITSFVPNVTLKERS